MENISTTVPTWQHPILPGQALQGNILVTKNDFKEPPQSQSNFEWVDIEDLCGVHDVKATVDTDKNIITLYKTGGHRNQDGTWVEDWIPYIEIQQLTKELVDILTNMLYIEYRFNIVNNDGDEDYSSINIQGVRKDGITIDDLGTFKTYSIKKLDEMFAESGASIEAEKTAREQADATLQTNIDKEKEDRNTEDDKLHTYLQQETANRTNADKTLQDNIDSEKSSRETADTNLEKSLNSEKIDRAKADATLTTNLNTETTNRTTADTTLQTNIDNEKSARETAIKGLEDKIAKLPVSDSIYTKTETDALLLKKQDKLTAGDNITIDENNKISATGGGSSSNSYIMQFNKGTGIAYAISSYEEVTMIGDFSGTALKVNFNEKCVTGKKIIETFNNNSQMYKFSIKPCPQLRIVGSSYVPSTVKDYINKDNSTYKDYYGLCAAIAYTDDSGNVSLYNGGTGWGIIGKYDTSGNYYYPEYPNRQINISQLDIVGNNKCLIFFVQTGGNTIISPSENFVKQAIYYSLLDIQFIEKFT